ncbi:MAG: YggS family pyridoxal phosphate-dependent enzyme [Gammaproteobacteria bacterium]|nr:YggS family pyridoxal phosphate-dependent enzyme [Gammaproteobacteria bacterium]
MFKLAENISAVRAEIHRTAQAAGRSANTVMLLAVSKGQPVEAIAAAVAAGVCDFGENQVQEALQKMAAFSHECLRWHFIGAVQSNKTRAIAEHFDWLHSLDRLSIAERLARQRPSGMAPLDVCLQVNIDRESTKAGVDPDQLEALALGVVALPALRLRGLMAIPRPRAVGDQRQPFRELASLLARLRATSPRFAGLDTLSMGMSADLDAAIAEGATIVRIGRAIFGPRPDLQPHR